MTTQNEKAIWTDVPGTPTVIVDVELDTAGKRVLVAPETLATMAEAVRAAAVADPDETERFAHAILSAAIPDDAVDHAVPLRDVTEFGGGYDRWLEMIVEPADDSCPRCGGDHDRIDRREPCPIVEPANDDAIPATVAAYLAQSSDDAVVHARKLQDRVDFAIFELASERHIRLLEPVSWTDAAELGYIALELEQLVAKVRAMRAARS